MRQARVIPSRQNLANFEYDVVVVGQGLAGTTLAWHLQWLGQRVLVVDREVGMSASRVAAGLMTPLTGKRCSVCWRFEQLYSFAKTFYEKVEARTGRQFFVSQPAVRLFASEEDASRFALLASNPAVASLLTARDDVVSATGFRNRHGGVEMAPAGRLDVPTFLDASRADFAAQGTYRRQGIHPVRDLELTGHGVVVSGIGLVGKVVFCQGIEAIDNTWFDDVPFEPARGELLTVRLPGLREARVVHRGIWLAPLGNERFRVGATFSPGCDPTPTMSGRQELLERLGELVQIAPIVEDHAAAVRPIVQGRLPRVGCHPTYPQLGFFNGLGSKGALRAPYVASQFANALVRGDDVEPALLHRPNKLEHASQAPTARRLTQRAHAVVATVLSSGDAAIDATVGNGLDTLFLARRVGRAGRVLGFDVQQAAIDRTRRRLDAEGIAHVELVHASHERLSEWVPRALVGGIQAIMFNLGYLPRGDKTITTQARSTLEAIESGLPLLATPGVMTILAYTGHVGGLEEAQAIEAKLRELEPRFFHVAWPDFELPAGMPRLYVVRRLA